MHRSKHRGTSQGPCCRASAGCPCGSTGSGDEKLQVVQLLQDLIDNKQRSLEGDHKKLGKLKSSVGIINDSQIQFI